MAGNARNFIGKIAPFVPFRLLRQISGQNFIFPFYHTVSNEELPHLNGLYTVVNSAQFEKDLEFMLKYFEPATLAEVLQYIANGKPKNCKPMFYITFDDGMREIADVIAPILVKKGIQAAFFVNPAFLDNRQLFYRHKICLLINCLNSGIGNHQFVEIAESVGEATDMPALAARLKRLTYADNLIIDRIANVLDVDFNQYLKQQHPYLTYNQIIELHNQGFTIGSHSYDHPAFSALVEQEMTGQIKKSFGSIGQLLNLTHRIFAFPFTDDKVSESFIRDLPQSLNVSASFGTAGCKIDPIPTHIQRIAMENNNFNSARKILAAEYLYFVAKSLVGKHVMNRK